MEDMNKSRSRELKALDVWTTQEMIWTIMGLKFKALDVMNTLGLWMTWTTSSHELSALNAMNNIVLLIVMSSGL